MLSSVLPLFKNQRELFLYIKENRPNICQICGDYSKMNEARCYAHILDKGMWKKYRLEYNNIALVCSPLCHLQVDHIAKGKAFLIGNMLEDGESAEAIIEFLASEQQ